MGRGYIVEEAVESYLSQLCEVKSTTTTGLLIGQSSAQRDYIVMASRTPPKEDSPGNSLDKDWVTEHARQVSRMLPGGLFVLGVFIITEVDAKDIQATLRQLVFSVENLISSERFWSPADDDVTDCVTLHINSKTRKTVCRTFDIKDPKSMAKPADWKYQSAVCSSWVTVSCCLNVNIYFPLPTGPNTPEKIEKCIKDELKIWAQQIESGVCLLDGKKVPDDVELTTGQRRNAKQAYTVQLLISPCEQQFSDVVQKCGGSVSIKGAVHCRAYVHGNKPKAKLAERLLKRDIISMVATRVHMLLEELMTAEGRNNNFAVELSIPRRIFCPVKGRGPVSVCDYQFSDEGPLEATERLKEMLDLDAAEEDIDTTQEITPENINTETIESKAEIIEEKVEDPAPQRNNYIGVVMASAVALLATAASLLYLTDV
ncbi:protein odr-4 homolog [Periophthalmus magnuspinnatus]|uniref:protein odr-4 homolog n=1 Tax=Periophthalmus magnuspinnatus TaxID=409849 RepID=UPI00145A6EEC|nr:protein odr-4 homolog [Periophthalmus magnuspinnatus]